MYRIDGEHEEKVYIVAAEMRGRALAWVFLAGPFESVEEAAKKEEQIGEAYRRQSGIDPKRQIELVWLTVRPLTFIEGGG